MFYNVENLFDLVEDGTEYQEYLPGKQNWNAGTFRRKIDNLSSAIAAAAADIVILCEVENRHVLGILAFALKKKGVHYPFSETGDRPNSTNTNTAVLSMLPITGSMFHGVPPIEGAYTRNILEVDFDMGGCTLKIFANHWPSKRHPESHRIAAAQVLAQRLYELPPVSDYLLAGDFNAGYDECETFRSARLDDTGGKTGINHVLKTVVSQPGEPVEYVTRKLIEENPAGKYHYNLWFELPVFRRLSYVYRNRPETPDAFILPASLFDDRGISYVDGSFRVFRWNGRLIMGGRPYRWQFTWSGSGRRHVGDGYSDHLPILMALRVGPFEPGVLHSLGTNPSVDIISR